MDSKPSTASHALMYGLIIGLLLIIISVVLYFLELGTTNGMQYISYILIIGGLIFSIKNYRDNVLDGYLYFGQGFAAGFLTTLFFSLLYSIYAFAFFNFVDPDFIGEIHRQAEDSMIQQGLSDTQIDTSMEYTRRFTTPAWMAVWSFLMFMFIGTIVSLIASVFLRRNPPYDPGIAQTEEV